MRWISITFGLLSVVACDGSEQRIHRQSQVESFRQDPTNEIDILWVVDDSQSMANEQAKIADRFDDFLTGINDAGVDWHIGVISTDLDNLDTAALLQGEPAVLTTDTPEYRSLFQERVRVGIDGSDKEKGIDAAFQALTEPLLSGPNEGFRRPGATLMVNYFSDENDCSDRGALLDEWVAEPCYDRSEMLVPVIELIRDYRTLTQEGERMYVSAIVGPKIAAGCEGAKPGSRYNTMADAFGGLKGNICDQDFDAIMGELGLQAGGISTSFILEHYAVASTIKVWVDDEPIDEDEESGWTYDSRYHVLYFHGDGVPPRGSKIQVEYDIAQQG
jgi:hypothetical protein